MPTQQTDLNSQISVGLVQDPPDNLKSNDAKTLYSTVIGGFNNLIRGIEQFCGVTQKDITQWSGITPSDTILTYNLRRLYVTANVDLPYGTFVNLFDSGTILEARKSDSGVPRLAHGYVNVVGGALAGEITEVILFEGLIPISGILRGTNYYLALAGAISNAPGATKQYVGFGVADDLLCVRIDSSAY